jgi:hypothetical protein
MGKVTVWQMSEEERLAYIEKHPIVRTKKDRAVNFTSDQPDYKWRGQKAADSRWGNDNNRNL